MKIINQLKVVIIIAAISVASQAQAATYYVATTGNDGNPGTSEATAFKTIQKGADVAKAGDTVIVLPGTYNEGGADQVAIRQTNDGTASNRITFISKDFKDGTGRWGAKIVGTSGNVVLAIIGDYVDVIGFDITASNDARNGIVLYGAYTRALYNHVHDFRAPKCDDGGGAGIGTGNYDAPGKEVIGNVVHHIATAHLTGPGCNFIHGIYMEVEDSVAKNNIVYQTAGAGIHAWHDPKRNIISHNLSFNNRRAGIIFGCGNAPNTTCSGIRVYNNISMNNGGRGILEYGRNDGTNVVEGNITLGNLTDTPVMVNGTARNNLIGVNPQLVNFQPNGGGDYRLTASSPAIDAASTACSSCLLPIDIVIGARPAGSGYDIGPYEYGAAPGNVGDLPIPGGGSDGGGEFLPPCI